MNKLKLGIISFRYACNILQDDVRTGMCKWYKYIQICFWYVSSVMWDYDRAGYAELIERKKLHDTTYKDIKERGVKNLTFTIVNQGEADFKLIYDALKTRYNKRKAVQ